MLPTSLDSKAGVLGAAASATSERSMAGAGSGSARIGVEPLPALNPRLAQRLRVLPRQQPSFPQSPSKVQVGREHLTASSSAAPTCTKPLLQAVVGACRHTRGHLGFSPTARLISSLVETGLQGSTGGNSQMLSLSSRRAQRSSRKHSCLPLRDTWAELGQG